MNAPFGISRGNAVQRFERRESQGWLPRGWIDGLTLSNDATDATNDLAFAPGSARSTCRIVDGAASTLARDQIDLDLPVSIIKQLDVAFAPDNYDPDGYSGGGRSGGRSSSAVSDTTWHALLAGGGGGLPTDIFLHDSATQSSILAEMQKIGGYTAYRRIGSLLRSTSIVAFTQRGDHFDLSSPTIDTTATNQGTSAVTRTLTSLPNGIVVEAKLNCSITPGTSGTVVIAITALTATDVAPGTGANALATFNSITNATDVRTFQTRVFTNTAREIRTRWSASGASDVLRIAPTGWIDRRDRDA